MPRLSLCCSIFIVVSITVERFLAVTKPHYRLISNVKRAVCYIVPCVILAILLNFSKFFETETVTFCLDFTACGCGYHSKMYVRPTQLRLSQVKETRQTRRSILGSVLRLSDELWSVRYA